MNDTKDHRILSPELYEQLKLHQVKRGNATPDRSLENNEGSLRQFNAELLEKIGDFRKRNLELASIENALRIELGEQSKRETNRERELTAKFTGEIETLKKALGEARLDHERNSEEWQRKLSRMTDESWSKGLEVTKLKSAFEQERSALQDAKTALEDELETTRSQLLDQQRRAEKTRTELSAQLEEANELIAGLQEGLEAAKSESVAIAGAAAREKAMLTDQYRTREQQLYTTFDALKLDYERLSHGFNQATETATHLRAELQRATEKHRNDLEDQQNRLREAFVTEQHELFAENAKLKDLLSQRETRNAAESESLLKWRDQLSSLDSHLKGLSDLLKRGRADLLRAAKKVNEEIDFALANPFTDYLQVAEKEVDYLQKQISAASPLSPVRSKQEARLGEAISHRDAIRGLLEGADAPLRDHAKTIQALLKNLEANR